MPFCFRIHFKLSHRRRIDSDESELLVPDAVEGRELRLKAVQRQGAELTPLKESLDHVLLGRGFDTESEASASADKWLGILQKAFAQSNIGADFGERAPKGGFTRLGLQMLEQEADGQRFLNDVHGISVFECDPPPLFVSHNFEVQVNASVDGLQKAIDEANRRSLIPSDRERLAYDLYAASFWQESVDARFVTLMMAVETLIDPQPRAEHVREHVDRLIAETAESELSEPEKASITGSLRWLRSESINQAGRRLARKLGGQRFLDDPNSESAARFFTRCYDLRSRLVHGHHPRPSMDELGVRAAHLEIFVASLLSLEFEPEA